MLATAGRTKYFEDLEVGQEASMSRIVSEADIVAYAALSGDYNPVHLDSEYAAKTIFKERIAHGILSAGYISAIFGMKLPGPGAIYVSQTLFFKGPVKIDDRVETILTGPLKDRLCETLTPPRQLIRRSPYPADKCHERFAL